MGRPYRFVPDEPSGMMSLYVALKLSNESSVCPHPANHIPGGRKEEGGGGELLLP